MQLGVISVDCLYGIKYMSIVLTTRHQQIRRRYSTIQNVPQTSRPKLLACFTIQRMTGDKNAGSVSCRSMPKTYIAGIPVGSLRRSHGFSGITILAAPRKRVMRFGGNFLVQEARVLSFPEPRLSVRQLTGRQKACDESEFGLGLPESC